MPLNCTDDRPNRRAGTGRISTAEQEARHRIANSLSILSAMLRLESRRITSVDDARSVLLLAASRLNAASRLHRALLDDGRDGGLRLDAHLAQIKQDLGDSIGIRVAVRCPDIDVTAVEAVGIGAIVCEMAMNAVKHSGNGASTEVAVEVSRRPDGDLLLVVRDNGVGLPDGFDVNGANGLGMTIILKTVERMNGVLEPVRGPGATFRVTIPGERLSPVSRVS